MTAVAIVLAGTFIAAGLLVAYGLCKIASDTDDHMVEMHDDWLRSLHDDGGEAYDPDDIA